MPEPKPEDSFKVVDRRLFTPEGDLRKEALEQERREEAAAREKPAQKEPTEVGATANATSPAAEQPPPSRNFQMLVDFLGRNAALLLGGYADPRTGQAILDLEGARELIDMLDTLREKTRGHLHPDDDRLLLDVLGSLKMTYLEMTKAAAQAMQEKAKSKP